jgi:hypothetical protein
MEFKSNRRGKLNIIPSENIKKAREGAGSNMKGKYSVQQLCGFLRN